MSGKKPNRLINSTSPYLLQHAYNPVDWFEWGPDAFQKAKKEDKPILVSIGYSACHWCHVMEREAFENDDIAAIMNEHFISIKVDREERPDVDQIYMDALQAMGTHGGWPLNVFLTPDQLPFYGGTYFPPKNWSQLLVQISRTFQQKRSEINQSSQEIVDHLNVSDLQRFAKETGPFDEGDFIKIFQNLEMKFDPRYGGLDKAPKFVMPTLWMWLLRYHHITKNKKALDMVTHTLRQLAMGGIYDQVAGGFARYSVDARWFAPHFEKMLYDNAQLVSLYTEAYRVAPDTSFKNVVYETVDWLQREMMHPEGGFYSALDADSEGMEGNFYTWTFEELHTLLEKELPLITGYFNVTKDGNWEHGRNILYRTAIDPLKDTAIESAKARLLEERGKRIRPSQDDKILTGWNAMMALGLLDAYNTFSETRFLHLALKNIQFLEKYLIVHNKCYRTFKNKRSDTEGFLEDYAFLIKAYISLYQATFEEQWLTKASTWCTYVVDHFWDETEGYFYFTSSSAEKLIARKKEVFDNVIPSSNSVMARNLFHLGTLLDRNDWKAKAVQMTSSLKTIITSAPDYNSHWALLALEISNPFAEIVIVGTRALEFRNELAKHDIPFSVFVGTEDTSDLPLLKDKPASVSTTVYVCYNNTCNKPVVTIEEALANLRVF